jgi:hypothetical protein
MLKFFLLVASIILTGMSIACVTDAQIPNKSNAQSAWKFKEFFLKFEADPAFQVSRITFPLSLIKTNDDGKREQRLIIKNQWKYTNILNLRNAVITYKKISVDSMNVQYAIKDTGVSVDHIFNKKQGVWKLCLIVDNSD